MPSTVVVDDYADTAQTLATLLRYLGCDSTGTSFNEALQLIHATRPGLVFIDIGRLPDRAFALSGQIRERVPRERTKLVGISPYARQSRFVAKALEAGFDTLIYKPTTAKDLEHVLRDLAQL